MLYSLCVGSLSPWRMVCSLSCGIPLSSSCFFSVPSALTCTYAPFLSCMPLSHAHRCSSAYMPTLSLSLSFCASLSWLLSAVSWFHSFQSVCLATGIFADVSVLQPQPLRERERDALEAEGDKREETITLRLTLPPWPRPEVWDLDVRICAFKSLHGCAFPELSTPPYVRARLSRSQ